MDVRQDVEPLWRSRARWRLKGALLWPAFWGLTLVDALMLGELPIAGDDGTDLVPALLLSLFFNLLAVAVAAPLAAFALRRRRPSPPTATGNRTTRCAPPEGSGDAQASLRSADDERDARHASLRRVRR